jgi:hypothetical protein
MRLSSTFTSVFGMGGGSIAAAGAASTPVPGAGTGAPTGSFTDLRDAPLAALGGSLNGQIGSGHRSAAADQHSDSARSSLSITGQTNSSITGDAAATPAAAAGLNASSSSVTAAAAGAASISATLPRAANVRSSGSNAAGGSSSFSLGSYYGLGSSSRDPGQTGQTVSDDGGWGASAPASAAAGGIGDRARRGSRQVTREPPSPVLRGLVTRPELALCLLTEVGAVLASACCMLFLSSV